MRLIFHGRLRDLFGEEATMQADSVREAIEGFSRQQSDWPREMRVAAVGFDTEEKLGEAADEVHLMPSLIGGQGKFTSIIIGAAMIAAPFLLPGIGIGISAALSASLIVSGSLMVLSGIMQLFTKSPKSTTSSDPAASKYLAVNKNTTAQGTPMIMAWGRIDISPHWLSIQSDSINLSHGVFPSTP